MTGARLLLRLAPCLALCLALFAGARPAWAHASLLRADPAPGSVLLTPPAAITLYFSEPIDLPVHALAIEAPNGALVHLARPTVEQDDPAEMVEAFPARASGTYLVRWKVISADTHPVWGTYTFSIGAPSALPPPMAGASAAYTDLALALQVAGRWLNVLGSALVIGPLVAWWWTLAAAASGVDPAARRRAWGRLIRLVGLGGAAVGIAVPVSVLGQMAGLADSWGEALSMSSLAQVFSDRLGYILTARALCAILIWVLASILVYLPPPARAGRLVWVTIGLGAVPLLSTSLIGHAVSTDPVAISVALDVLHLGAMAVWTGGLIALIAALPALRVGTSGLKTAASRANTQCRADPRGYPAPRPQGRGAGLDAHWWAILARVVPDFSRLALLCVATLGVTGLYAALRNVASPDELVTTPYGQTLLVKSGLMALVLAIAATHLLVTTPALRRVGSGTAPRLTDLWPLFGPLIRLEAVLVVAILAAAGTLTALAPARQAARSVQAAPSSPITVASVVTGGSAHVVLVGRAGGVVVTLAVAPVRDGPSAVAVSLTVGNGVPVSGGVTLRLMPPPGSGLAVIDAPLARQALGQFAGAFTLAWPGRWTFALAVNVHGHPPAPIRFFVRLP